jgi:hypothetical protein
MRYYNEIFDDSIDLFYLRKLPQFVGMSEDDLRALFIRILKTEEKLWDEEIKRRLNRERAETLAAIENNEVSPLPPEPVKIAFGVKIYPALIDDKGFVSHDDLARQRRTMKLSQNEHRKIYL